MFNPHENSLFMFYKYPIIQHLPPFFFLPQMCENLGGFAKDADLWSSDRWRGRGYHLGSRTGLYLRHWTSGGGDGDGDGMSRCAT